MKKEQAGASAGTPEELSAKLSGMLKTLIGKRTASTVAKKCGVSVSTITRIRNGENKRGIGDELLHKLWLNREPGCNIDLSQLMSLNSEVSAAYMQRESAKWDQEQQEADLLEKQIQRNMMDSGVFLRKTGSAYEIIPGVELYCEMAYELAFESGEKKRVLFFTQFHSKRRIEQMEKRKEEEPALVRFSLRHYRTIIDFCELRKLHPEYENSELVIVFNYEADFRCNAEALSRLSDPARVTLALIGSDAEKPRGGRFLEEICLDGREKGVLGELGLIR